MPAPDLAFENSFGEVIAGIDEAGRGPWAGPVVAAAVILNKANIPPGIHDSKKLTPAKREAVHSCIMETAQVGIGVATAEEIDSMNILQATFLAMQRAFSQLSAAPHMILVDGNRLPALPCPARAIIGGDARCPSIAAASIVAKVTRDRMMAELAREYPHYGWERNAGYGTKCHQEALARYGVTPHHRRSYKPIRTLLETMQIAAA